MKTTELMKRKCVCPKLKSILSLSILFLFIISFCKYIDFVTSFNTTSAFTGKQLEVNNLNNRWYNNKTIKFHNKTLRQVFPHIIRTQETDAKGQSYTYIIGNEKVRSCDNDIFMSVLVHTAIAHFERRTFIRNTWGNAAMLINQKIKVVFLLGKPDERKLQTAINFESQQYNDIVQGPFLDTYQNLTYKALFGLRWATGNCGQAKFVLKIDDDVVVNTPALLKLLASKYANVNLTIFCAEVRPNGTSSIFRGGKYKVEQAQFPNMTHWPVTYCPGRYLIYTAGVIKELMAVVNQTPFVWLDDVFVTGFLASNVGYIKLVSAKDISKQFSWLENAKKDRLLSAWNRFPR